MKEGKESSRDVIIFSILDTYGGYWEIEIARGYGDQTAFSSYYVLSQSSVMLFGLKIPRHISVCSGPQPVDYPVGAPGRVPGPYSDVFEVLRSLETSIRHVLPVLMLHCDSGVKKKLRK